MIFESVLVNTEKYLKDISLLSYIVIFLGGVFTSLTPCVYPLIPITIGYIGASSDGERCKGFMLSFFYVLGIAATYSCLGLVAALSGRLFGEISTSPWAYLIVGNVFLILGLSMVGCFNIHVPRVLSIQLVTQRTNGIINAFLVGLAAGFVVGPCTAPVLGAVLTYVASKQNIILGATLLFTFAFGMGFLIILIGTFTGLITSLPKSGRWLNMIKIIFGIILIICAEYFIILSGKRF